MENKTIRPSIRSFIVLLILSYIFIGGTGLLREYLLIIHTFSGKVLYHVADFSYILSFAFFTVGALMYLTGIKLNSDFLIIEGVLREYRFAWQEIMGIVIEKEKVKENAIGNVLLQVIPKKGEKRSVCFSLFDPEQQKFIIDYISRQSSVFYINFQNHT